MEEARPRLVLMPNLRRPSPPPIWPPEEPLCADNSLNSSSEDEDSSRMEIGMRNAITEELAESESRQNQLRLYVNMYGHFPCLQNNELFRLVAKPFLRSYMDLLSKLDVVSDLQMQEDLEYEFEYRIKRLRYESRLHCGIWIIHDRDPQKVTWKKILHALRDMQENGTLDKLFSPEHQDKWEKLTASQSDQNANHRQPVESFIPDECVREYSQPQLILAHNHSPTVTSVNNNSPTDSGVGPSFPASIQGHSQYSDRTVTTTSYPQQFYAPGSQQHFQQISHPGLNNDYAHVYQSNLPVSHQWHVYHQQPMPFINETIQMNSNFTRNGYNSLSGIGTPSTVTIHRQITPRSPNKTVVLIAHSEDALLDAERLASNLWTKKKIMAITLKNIKESSNEPVGMCLDRIFKMLTYFVPVISPMYIHDIESGNEGEVATNNSIQRCESVYSMMVKRIHCEMEKRFINDRCKNYFVRPVHTSDVTFDMRRDLGPYLMNSRKLWDDENEFMDNLVN